MFAGWLCCSDIAAQDVEVSGYGRKIKRKDLAGGWKVTAFFYYDSNLDAADDLPYRWLTYPDHFYFEGDSLFEINDPCILLERKSFTHRRRTISISDQPSKKWDIYVQEDTLIFLIGRPESPDYCLHLVRSEVQDSTILYLKQNRFDLRSMNGTFERSKNYHFDEYGDPKDEIVYPFRIPEVLELDEGDWSTWAGPGLAVKIPVDGVLQVMQIVPRNFHKSYFQVDYGEHEFTFRRITQ